MKKSDVNFIYFIVVHLTFYSCSEMDNSEINKITNLSDKQIRINLDFDGIGTMDTVYSIGDLLTYLNHFNVEFYTGVDSIIFTSILRSTDTNSYIIIELFNLTDNIPIAMSRLSSNKPYPGVLVESPNLYSGFPKKEISIAPRLKCTKQNASTFVANPKLYLYRK